MPLLLLRCNTFILIIVPNLRNSHIYYIAEIKLVSYSTHTKNGTENYDLVWKNIIFLHCEFHLSIFFLTSEKAASYKITPAFLIRGSKKSARLAVFQIDVVVSQKQLSEGLHVKWI